MILRLDHVGLMTQEPTQAAALMAALGFRRVAYGGADDYDVRCEFWSCGHSAGDPVVELVSPASSDSAVTRLLQRTGPGLYHLALEVEDLDYEIRRLRHRGFVPIDGAPRSGALPGMTVGFLYGGRPLGMLIELVSYSAPQPAS